MTLSRAVAFWLALAVAAIFVVWLLSGILLPFIAAMAIAYLLDPLVGRMERTGLSRLVATLMIIALLIVILAILAMLVMPVLIHQLSALIENLPAYFQRVRAVLLDPQREWLQRWIGSGFADADKSFADVVTQGAGWLGGFLRSLWSGGQALISILSLLILTPVVAVYLLLDWDRMIAVVDSCIPLHHRATVRALAEDMNRAIAGFIRGQAAVCVILGAFYAIALSVVGLNYGFLIGLLAGFLSFIPFVGSFTGFVLAVGIAIAQFWPDWTWVLVVAGIFVGGQLVEGNLLSPKLVGSSVGLHPVWLIFSLFAFGYLLGFVGLLIAVPLAASIGILLRFALAQYRMSEVYQGKPSARVMDRTHPKSDAPL